MRRARIRQRRLVVLLRGWHWARLYVRVYLAGPDLREFLVPRYEAPSQLPHYDFEPDVRELILEEVRFDVFAEWSDPRDWLSVAAAVNPTVELPAGLLRGKRLSSSSS